MIKVKNKYHGSPSARRPDALQINIMRPSLLGNPYEVGKDGDREDVVAKFRTHLATAYDFDPKVREVIQLLEQCLELGIDVDLVCCCKPKPCHGDVIVDFVHDKEIPF